MRANVSNHWTSRELRKLHEDFTLLGRIAANLSAYTDIYLDTWNQEIAKSVEAEIEAYKKYAERILPFIVDTVTLVNESHKVWGL